MTDSTNHTAILEELMKQEKESKQNQPDFAALAKQLLPVILSEIDTYTEVADTLVDKLAPELAKHIDRYRAFIDEQDVKSFKTLLKGGMEPHQAVDFMIARKQATASAVRNFNNSLASNS